ncbi:class B basic helix-loop-helix protein 4/5 [Sarotherodon galilaeus]
MRRKRGGWLDRGSQMTAHLTARSMPRYFSLITCRLLLISALLFTREADALQVIGGSVTAIQGVPPFTSVMDNLPTLGTEEVLFATCTATGSKPPAEVRWLTGALGDKVRTTTNSTQYDNGMTTTVSSLFGVPTRKINGHQVQCVISGDSLSTEETLAFTIQVYFSPIEVKISAISEDSFECVTEANPNAKFTWIRSGQYLLESAVKVEGANLQLLSLTSDLNGLYQCEASNAYGSKHGQLYMHVTSGTCRVAWALFLVLLSLNVGAAAWYFYKSGRFQSCGSK